MGAVTGMLGLAGGAGGTGFAGPQMPNLVNPVTGEQISQGYQQTQQGLQQQQALLNAIQQQQGLQNQSQVYQQLQGIAAGTGPNPALAQLQQTTGQNIASQQALMAGQRGAGANVGLMARQAGQQGGALQQQAAGQAATMAAQQQLGAIGQAGQMANVQAANQIGQSNALMQAQLAQQQALYGAQGNYNQALAGAQSSVNAANAAMAGQRLGQMGSAIGGLAQGVAAGATMAAMAAHGGEISSYADGGDVQESAFPSAQSRFGQFLFQQPEISAPRIESIPEVSTAGNEGLQKGMAQVGKRMMMPSAPAAPVTAPLPGAMNVPMAAHGGMTHDYRSGGHVKAKHAGEKAVKHGDNYANDKIPAVLSEHEIVIPRSVTMGPNPVKGSADFVAQVIAKRKVGR